MEKNRDKERVDWAELNKRQVEALLYFDAHSEIFRQDLESFRGRPIIEEQR